MTKLSPFKSLGLALGAVALLLTSNLASAVEIRANAGTTFTLEPTADSGVFTHTVDGVVQVSLLGNCSFHGDVVAQFPADPSQPIALKGSGTFTSADGLTTLTAAVEGAATLDPANPSFGNFYYRVRFTGGSGRFEAARGVAVIKGAALFTSATTGKATWTLKGYLNETGK